MFKKLLMIWLAVGLVSTSFARPLDEGMWLPFLIGNMNYAEMKKMGLKLTPEQIYSINNSSLKDAVVRMGRGFCTGEIISSQGLLLTNHHCAYDAIQSLSSIEDDILTNGFWAKALQQERPVKDLSVSFLVRMEDVGPKIKAELTDQMTLLERMGKIREISEKLEKEAVEGTHYTAEVRSFFDGNEFYMMVYETFNDVRLVGNPSESIGKYGGDTDNWMWPRHTGDFALMRVYAGKDGKPAEYSADNVPMKPRHSLPISLDGVRKNDYVMVMGYPGTTDRYLTSWGVQLAIDQTNPKRVEIREKRLELMKVGMDADPKVRLQYASKYATVSNYWKYFIGQTRGLKRLKVYDKKVDIEKRFQQWADATPDRKARYGNVLAEIERGYEKMKETNLDYYYMLEAVFGTEILPFAFQFNELNNLLEAANPNEQAITATVARLSAAAEEYYKDYHAPTDQRITAALLGMYMQDASPSLRPDLFGEIEKSFAGNTEAFAADMFARSMFASEDRLKAFLANPNAETLSADPAFQAASNLMNNFYQRIAPGRRNAQNGLSEATRLFVEGYRNMNPGKKFYPNANSTMRLTYGKVLDYLPMDAVMYSYYTTEKGILEKEDPSNPEFILDPKLKQALMARDFGQYADQGEIRVCFISNNDITGGNSGSPVINAKGELVGLAFDGNWEAMSGDIAFEPELQRCISVDIRYVLFIIDKVGGATNLINEMKLVKSTERKSKSFRLFQPAKY